MSEAGEQNENQNKPTAISRIFFHPDKDVTVAHVQQVWGDKSIHMTQDELEESVARIRTAKKNATACGHNEVGNTMVSYMQELGYKVACWSELIEKFKGRGDAVFLLHLWDAAYGQYDDMKRWPVKMEEDWMCNHNLEYLGLVGKNGRPPKGCFARLYSICKCDMIKKLNRAGKSAHGGEICLQRSKQEIEKGGKGRKRKKGMSLGACATVKGVELFHTEETTHQRHKRLKREQGIKFHEELTQMKVQLSRRLEGGGAPACLTEKKKPVKSSKVCHFVCIGVFLSCELHLMIWFKFKLPMNPPKKRTVSVEDSPGAASAQSDFSELSGLTPPVAKKSRKATPSEIQLKVMWFMMCC